MKARDKGGTHGRTPLPHRREFLRSLPHRLLERCGALAREGIWAFSSNADAAAISRDLVAQVEVSRCHAWSGLICQQCYLACPKRDRAIEMRDQKPVIMDSVCDGCAMCITACQTVNNLPAIRMVDRVPAAVNIEAGGQIVTPIRE